MGSLLCRGRHFGSWQPRSSQGDFGQSPLQRRGAAVPTRAECPPTTSPRFSGPPVAIMAGFMRQARFVAQERRTMRAATSASGHAPLEWVTDRTVLYKTRGRRFTLGKWK
ncbi:hypothetical protein NDU88_005362 [Pleurodeles waltl]|uniref:Uncharacterized protein n=1 Tax=Pleurodeles waltl TaxID=8319 RepID=A0AAV7WBR4_PLEWA|nr:hypothetical protein NDU88_005362 [Pleurodeles waltl]